MKKYSKISLTGKNEYLVLLSVVVLLLIILSVYFLYVFFNSSSLSNKVNKYLIENKYYGFKLQTPKGWVAKGKTMYTEDTVADLLDKCKNNKLTKEIGQFRFQSQKYPDAFGDSGYLPEGLSSGVVLDIIINCISDTSKIDMGDSKISGEKATEIVFDSPEFGKTSQLSSLHNGLQYNISKYIYISPADSNNSKRLRADYIEVIDNIISNFTFIK